MSPFAENWKVLKDKTMDLLSLCFPLLTDPLVCYGQVTLITPGFLTEKSSGKPVSLSTIELHAYTIRVLKSSILMMYIPGLFRIWSRPLFNVVALRQLSSKKNQFQKLLDGGLLASQEWRLGLWLLEDWQGSPNLALAWYKSLYETNYGLLINIFNLNLKFSFFDHNVSQRIDCQWTLLLFDQK